MGKKTEISIGLDRIDNSKGYEPGNVVSCCNVCNTIKNKYLSLEETKAAVQLIVLIRAKHQEVNSILEQISSQLDLQES